ncbi:hypothetical protein [Pseudomonas sp. KCJK9058]|uniref:hypothetical protein n=1 Tax=Pseudomonas sp. KCJK9058 TaxID=3344563 RepID=UPI003905B08D
MRTAKYLLVGFISVSYLLFSILASATCGMEAGRYDPDCHDYSSNGKNGSSLDDAARVLNSVGASLKQYETQRKIERERQEADAQRAADAAAQAAQKRDLTLQQDYAREASQIEADSDWRARAKSYQKSCNCQKIVGRCSANISIIRQGKTGTDYKVTTNEPNCAKVSYFIDTTPYFSIAGNKRPAFEHSASMKKITMKNFDIEKCEVCSYE